MGIDNFLNREEWRLKTLKDLCWNWCFNYLDSGTNLWMIPTYSGWREIKCDCEGSRRTTLKLVSGMLFHCWTTVTIRTSQLFLLCPPCLTTHSFPSRILKSWKQPYSNELLALSTVVGNYLGWANLFCIFIFTLLSTQEV